MIMFQFSKRNRPHLNGKERPIKFISKAGFTSRIVNVLITYYAHRSCLCSYWKKYSEGKDFIIPSTFRDKTNVSFPTSNIFLSAHPFGHCSSQDYLMASVKPLFSHPRLFSRRQIKIYKCQKSCQASLFDWVPFSILYTYSILYFSLFVKYYFSHLM